MEEKDADIVHLKSTNRMKRDKIKRLRNAVKKVKKEKEEIISKTTAQKDEDDKKLKEKDETIQ